MDVNDRNQLVRQAVAGDSKALESLLVSVQDLIFNLSLRMLGTIPDAEDAVQEILIRVMTNLSEFRQESSFQTWVYRIAVNYLLNYKKSMFAHAPLNFEFYGNDIRYGAADQTQELVERLEQEQLEEELKMSCTNVMLQCLEPKERCIFILGTMFRLDSRIAGEILSISAENYRQKLSRIRKKVGDFLSEYCGLSGTGMCSCKKRISYAVAQKRLDPKKLDYQNLEETQRETMVQFKTEMERLDDAAVVFAELPAYRSPVKAQEYIRKLLKSPEMAAVTRTKAGKTVWE